MSGLPTVEDLRRLPLRAIAAYAARAARRVRPVLRGVIDDPVVDEILSIVDAVASTRDLDRMDASSALFAASRILAASVSAKTSDSQGLAVLSLVGAARTAYAVLQGAANASRAPHYIAYAASAADSAAQDCVALDEPAASAAAKAARADYDALTRELGQHSDVTIGLPIDLSEKSFLGPLV